MDRINIPRLDTIRASWKCPNCGQSPLKNCIVADGGSARCSDNNCNTIFHYCPQKNMIFAGDLIKSRCRCSFY